MPGVFLLPRVRQAAPLLESLLFTLRHCSYVQGKYDTFVILHGKMGMPECTGAAGHEAVFLACAGQSSTTAWLLIVISEGRNVADVHVQGAMRLAYASLMAWRPTAWVEY